LSTQLLEEMTVENRKNNFKDPKICRFDKNYVEYQSYRYLNNRETA